jgi:uncharacterized protein (TIGR02145 family)
MILTHGANSLAIGKYVEIGGRRYPVVKIGNQLWMAENLDWKFEGCVIGASGESTSEPRGNYYDNDETTYGVSGNKYGMLYNWEAATQINSLVSDGWKVPSYDDFGNLSAYLETGAGTKLKSTSGWYQSGNGTDDYGFNGVPSGFRQLSFMDVSKVAAYWTSTEIGTTDAYERGLSYSNDYIGGAWDSNKGFLFSIRLVKYLT